MGAHPPRQHVVGAPPEEHEAAEEQRGAQAVVDAGGAVVRVDAPRAVPRARVQPVGLARRVLDLQPRLDVLDGRRDEADGGAGEQPGEAVAERLEVADRHGEDVLGHEAPVDGQGAHEDRVHEHPADEGRGDALVQAEDALIADGLGEALQGPREASSVRSL